MLTINLKELISSNNAVNIDADTMDEAKSSEHIEAKEEKIIQSAPLQEVCDSSLSSGSITNSFPTQFENTMSKSMSSNSFQTNMMAKKKKSVRFGPEEELQATNVAITSELERQAPVVVSDELLADDVPIDSEDADNNTDDRLQAASSLRMTSSEALQIGVILAEQERRFGTNMYVSLAPEDDPKIDKYCRRGFTVEEAILRVFEKKYMSGDELRALGRSLSMDEVALSEVNLLCSHFVSLSFYCVFR